MNELRFRDTWQGIASSSPTFIKRTASSWTRFQLPRSTDGVYEPSFKDKALRVVVGVTKNDNLPP